MAPTFTGPKALGLIFGGLLLGGLAIMIVYLATYKSAGLMAPVPVPSPPVVANPTWGIKQFFATSTGAANAVFTVYMTAFGPLRTVRFVANLTTNVFVSNDFIYFAPATINGSDLPAFDPTNDYYYQTVDTTCLFNPTDVADCKFLVFTDGSALIGMKSYGIDGPWVETGVFDPSLIGTAFKIEAQASTWVTTFNAGPPVNAQLANPNTTAPVTATLFGTRYKSLHGITPRVTTPTPTVFQR
jgi:hypothetical protein